MGNTDSVDSDAFPQDSEIDSTLLESLIRNTHFTSQQIIRLLDKYKQLSKGGKIDPDDFIQKMHIQNREIGLIQHRMLDSDGGGTLSFEEFVIGLDSFHPDSDFDKKVKLCFTAYDDDGGGTISKDEIRKIILISLQSNTFCELSDAQLNNLVDELFDKYDTSHNGEMDQKAFSMMVNNAPGIIEAFELNITDILNDEAEQK